MDGRGKKCEQVSLFDWEKFSVSLVHCVALPLKLLHFFEFSGHAMDAPFPIKNRAAMAKYLKIKPARVTEWTQADDSKNRSANMIQDRHVEKLAELYSQLAPCPLPEREAYQYWRNVSAQVFRDGLVPRPDRGDLFRLLKDFERRVTIESELKPQGLGMMDVMLEPEPADLLIPVDQEFCLKMRRLRGLSAFVLVDAPEGLYLHVPNKAFNGLLTSHPQRLPPEKWWKFRTEGPHRVIVIELGCATPPFVRDFSLTGPLSERDINILVGALEDPARVPFWNWGSHSFHVIGK